MAKKKDAKKDGTISLDTYLLMQAAVFGKPTKEFKAADIVVSKTIVDEILFLNGVKEITESEVEK